MSSSNSSRRQFLQGVAVSTVAVAALNSQTAPASVVNMPFSAGNPRMGVIGVGGRGTALLRNFLATDVQVSALCDIVDEKAQSGQALVTQAGQSHPRSTRTASMRSKSLWRVTIWIWH